MIKYDEETIKKRGKRLGELLATSNLPKAVIESIVDNSGKFSLRQIDMLIDALAREQEQWQELATAMQTIEKQREDSQGELEKEQKKIATDFIDKVVSEEEKSEQKELKKDIEKEL